MNKMLILTRGELSRLNKYHVTTMSFVVAFIWFLLLFFIKDMALLTQLLPFVIIIDATMLSMVFIGAVMFFEKTESTLSTLLVTPVKTSELILSKVSANTFQNAFSSLLIVVIFFFLKDVNIEWFYMVPGILFAVFFHSLLGFVFSFHSKDFTTMLVNVMIYMFLFSIPPVLRELQVAFTNDFWQYVMLLSPTQSSIEIIKLGFGSTPTIYSLIAFFYLLTLCILGYFYYVYPKFKAYAVKQSGV
jgi:fluoroquinolone transport system permease protein